MKGTKRCPLRQLNINSRMIFCLPQSLAIEVYSFFWAQLGSSLKIWPGEANLLWHGSTTLPEVWKVHGLIPMTWPAIFLRQLCCIKPVRPTVTEGRQRATSSLLSAETGVPSTPLESTFGKSCGKHTAALRNHGWYFKGNPEQLIYYSICMLSTHFM